MGDDYRETVLSRHIMEAAHMNSQKVTAHMGLAKNQGRKNSSKQREGGHSHP